MSSGQDTGKFSEVNKNFSGTTATALMGNTRPTEAFLASPMKPGFQNISRISSECPCRGTNSASGNWNGGRQFTSSIRLGTHCVPNCLPNYDHSAVAIELEPVSDVNWNGRSTAGMF